ncbi:hypothetical protein B0H13DRAFT_1926686 [Mycena leptocephala]|nr:hypothetical protein B0H13DRAFT_1926686 [Mycena leptocephala]
MPYIPCAVVCVGFKTCVAVSGFREPPDPASPNGGPIVDATLRDRPSPSAWGWPQCLGITQSEIFFERRRERRKNRNAEKAKERITCQLNYFGAVYGSEDFSPATVGEDGLGSCQDPRDMTEEQHNVAVQYCCVFLWRLRDDSEDCIKGSSECIWAIGSTVAYSRKLTTERVKLTRQKLGVPSRSHHRRNGKASVNGVVEDAELDVVVEDLLLVQCCLKRIVKAPKFNLHGGDDMLEEHQFHFFV